MTTLPDHVRTLAAEAEFRFRCHSGTSCFTECCRELELALTPYDVIRLRGRLGLGAQEFLDRHAIIEFGPDDLYPKVYLAMVDDGRASCPFVEASGCRVYPDRPAACRTYPIGRGASLDGLGALREEFVVINEPHCLGFGDERRQTATEWQADQGLTEYNRANDLLLPLLTLLSRGDDREDLCLTDDQAELFIATLYHLDHFRSRLKDAAHSLPDHEAELIPLAVSWLAEQWQLSR